MKAFIFLSFVILVSTLCAEEKKSALAQPIAELKLTNGAVFRNVTVVRYEKERVVLKSSAGIGPLPYSYIPEPFRSKMQADRIAQMESKPVATTPAAAPAQPQTRRVSGDVFLGGGESQFVRVKFAGLKIAAYPLAAAQRAFDTNMTPTLPAPLAQTESNSEGQWSLDLPKDAEFMIYAKGTHRAARGDQYTNFEWRIKSTDITGDTLMLTEKNAMPSNFSRLERR